MLLQLIQKVIVTVLFVEPVTRLLQSETDNLLGFVLTTVSTAVAVMPVFANRPFY